MNMKIVKVKQYNSTYKHILMIDGEPVCIADGNARINECMQYVYGYNADINDGKVRKMLDKYRQPCLDKYTEMKKKRRKKQKRKATHKFTENIA